MDIDLQPIYDALKIIMPWITGGLAGAILTYLLNRRLSKKSRPRISIRTSSVNYSLPALQKTFPDLKVSYGNRKYEELSYHEIFIENISQKIVKSAPFVISFPKDAEILDENTTSEPVLHSITHDQEGLGQNQHRFTVEDIHPGDFCKIELMVRDGVSFSIHFRGADDVEIIAPNNIQNKGFEEDFGWVILWVALYITVGSIPLISSILRGALIASSTPFLYRLFLRWKRELTPKKQGTIYGPIVISDSGKVNLDFDPETGASSVNVNFTKRQSKVKISSKSKEL